VIDPAMVTRSALQNAASIAKNILTTEAIVAEVQEKDGGGGHGGGMRAITRSAATATTAAARTSPDTTASSPGARLPGRFPMSTSTPRLGCAACRSTGAFTLGAQRVRLVHGSPRTVNEGLFQDTPAATFARIAAGAGCIRSDLKRQLRCMRSAGGQSGAARQGRAQRAAQRRLGRPHGRRRSGSLPWLIWKSP
jgi:hypothetical protein